MVRIVHIKTIAMSVMAASFLSPVIAQAQTMTAGNGYDPMESARQVTSGSQTMMDASMANTYNAERALSNDSNDSDGTSSNDQSAAQARAANQKKKAAAAASAMGGDLAGEPTQSIMDDGKAKKTKSVEDDAEKAAAAQDPASMTPEDKARAAKVKAALAHADSYFKKPAQGSASSGAKAGSAAVSSGKIFSGYAHALDTITLSVAGQTVVLDHMSGPGSQEVCFRDALPWSCGEDGRDVTERAVSGIWMACRIRSGNHGQCYTESGEDVSDILIRRGYASRT